mmetsp:Transcript_32442/g.75378  ORF Transcript_32442/g.75378 Transcript_32442/m.75378 type:complete len:312 (+) Transcript_32442:79-1014(+)|eukprot:CAMPEP_0171110014 /NCGR_PEP_ID=MMETSP0766_2-20121228/71112_1 /TAXON_ID=439317 /ORGANISM="Gambierdiscus australes, Strain CAWD 149" /LENGTH=311 /DNA_ID=CAMNT_0011571833 /DNA_START=76 /DNA_END=1011 /DNA_ORIENTATION=-
MGDGQARWIAALLLLCSPAVRGLRKVAEWEPQAVAPLARKAGRNLGPGQKWLDWQRGEKTSRTKELREARNDKKNGGPKYVNSLDKFSTENEDYKKTLEAVTQKAYENINPEVADEDKVALLMYTEDYWREINRALRFPNCTRRAETHPHSSKQKCIDEKKKVRDLVRVMTRAVRLPDYLPKPTAQWLYRGTKQLMPILDGNYQEFGFEFQEESFMSTTTELNVALGRAFGEPADIKYILKIDCSNCSSFARDIRDLSIFPEEAEVIFPPGMPFKVGNFTEDQEYTVGNATVKNVTEIVIVPGTVVGVTTL